MRGHTSITTVRFIKGSSQKHLFVMDPIENLNLELDSSLRLARELELAGHEVHITEINSIGWCIGSPSAHAKCTELKFKDSAVSFESSPAVRRLLADFDGIHMRKDPPFDLEYVSVTWLLESAAGSAKIYNSPKALLSINEKLAIFLFPEASEPGLVSCDPEELLQFVLDQCDGDAVLKPLLLFGGRGVERLELKSSSKAQILETLKLETSGGSTARLLQPFNKAIYDGEVRAFAVGGKPLAWCLKKPAAGNFLANTRAGATLLTYEPTQAEVEMVTNVATSLLSEGVALIGFDLIGGALSEVNITSPRLLQAPSDKRNYYKEMANWLIADCAK